LFKLFFEGLIPKRQEIVWNLRLTLNSLFHQNVVLCFAFIKVDERRVINEELEQLKNENTVLMVCIINGVPNERSLCACRLLHKDIANKNVNLSPILHIFISRVTTHFRMTSVT